MPHVPPKLDSIEAIKRLAKLIKREKGIKHTAALDEAARRGGYVNYAHALGSLEIEPPEDSRPVFEPVDEQEQTQTRSGVVQVPTALLKLESRSHLALMMLLLGASARDPGGVAKVSIADVSEALLRGPRWRHKKELLARVREAVDAAKSLGITVDYEVNTEWPDEASQELADDDGEGVPPRSLMRH
jgi:hypothetical protein